MRLEVIVLMAFVGAAAAQETNRSTEPPADAPAAESSKTATTATDEAAARKASKNPSLDPKTANLADLKVAGYRIENRNGEKLYCRKDNETGSRVKGNTFCLTRAQLVEIQQNTKQMMNDITRDNSPKGN
jgi:hypothetical protein